LADLELKNPVPAGVIFDEMQASSVRLLTGFQNLFTGATLSEYNTGFRGFTRKVLETLPLLENSHDFALDNQMLVQTIYFRFPIGEISCPPSISKKLPPYNFQRSVNYGFGVLYATLQLFLRKLGAARFVYLSAEGRKLNNGSDTSPEGVALALDCDPEKTK
jgi:hypothetical protein